MKKDFSYGVIPIYKDQDGKFSVLILKHPGRPLRPVAFRDGETMSADFWGFPKGHKDEGETDIEAAKREFAEEAGIDDCEMIDSVKFIDHYAVEFEDDKYHNAVFDCQKTLEVWKKMQWQIEL